VQARSPCPQVILSGTDSQLTLETLPYTRGKRSGCYNLSMFSLPNFTPDPDDPHSGMFTTADGQTRRAYLKRMRSPERQATEANALRLIQQHGGNLPAPELIAEFQDESGACLLLSHETGVNLADLLPPSPAAQPRPPWYQRVQLPVLPSIHDLLPMLAETGRAVRALHSIQVSWFGKLVGENPNPYRRDGRAYTHQEIRHQAQVAVSKGILSSSLGQAVERWAERTVECLDANELPSLVHFDLHTGNIRVYADPQDGIWRLRSLYDFELARGWSPEWDIAYLQADLKYLANDPACLAWRSFLEGYGAVDPLRLRLFEGLHALTAAAYADRYPERGAWALPILTEIVENAPDTIPAP
jgi:aminoglycoside phosphotransferase (APT) family kinase protein